MDPITLEKIRAMNNYKRARFLHGFFQICVTAISLTILISKSAWFHLSVSRVNAFFLVTLPDISSYLVQPKIMFVICNVIVIILVGESKCVMSTPNLTSTESSDMYDEYVREKKANIPGQSSVEITQKLEVTQKSNLILGENHTDNAHASATETVKGDEMEDEKETWEDARGEEEEDIGRKRVDEQEVVVGRKIEDQEENSFPDDELNKRIEAFLARVNEQRRMEANLITVEV